MKRSMTYMYMYEMFMGVHIMNQMMW